MTTQRRPSSYDERVAALLEHIPAHTWGGRLRGSSAGTDLLPSQAQPKSGQGLIHPGFWVLVAAADAPIEWKRQAHFVCTGTADEVTIEAADSFGQDWVGFILGDMEDPLTTDDYEAHGILLSPGTFFLSTQCDISRSRWLQGTGRHTVITRASGAAAFTLLRFSADSAVDSYVSGYDDVNYVSDLVVNGDFTSEGTNDTAISAVVPLHARNVSVVNCGNTGFYLTDGGALYDCRMERCKWGLFIENGPTLVVGGEVVDCQTGLYSQFGELRVVGPDIVTDSGYGGSDCLSGIECEADNSTVIGARLNGTWTTAGIYADDVENMTLVGVQAQVAGTALLVEGSQVSSSACRWGSSSGQAVSLTGAAARWWCDGDQVDVSGTADGVSVAGGVAYLDSVAFLGSSTGYAVVSTAAGQVMLGDVDNQADMTYAIVGEQLLSGREQLVEGPDTVTVNETTGEVTVTAVWGVTDAGQGYHDATGVTAGEEANFLTDPRTGHLFLQRLEPA